MPSAIPFDLLDTHTVSAISRGTTIQELLGAAHCLPLLGNPVSLEALLPPIPASGIPSHTVDCIETVIDTRIGIEEFRQSIASAGRRSASVLSVLRIFGDEAVYAREWPPVLCVVHRSEYPVLVFHALTGDIFAGPVDPDDGIFGHCLFFCLPQNEL